MVQVGVGWDIDSSRQTRALCLMGALGTQVPDTYLTEGRRRAVVTSFTRALAVAMVCTSTEYWHKNKKEGDNIKVEVFVVVVLEEPSDSTVDWGGPWSPGGGSGKTGTGMKRHGKIGYSLKCPPATA